MFLETSDFRIRHNTNYMWIERCYNSSVAAAVAGNMIINAGVMLGSTRALLALFPLYIEQANGVTCVEDQPLLNVMVYSGRLFGKVNYSLHSNEFGPVFTGEAAHSYSMDSCSIKNARGQEYAVVHQWDRPKHVKAMVQTCGRFSPGGGHRPQA